ncbi:kinase binding protein CGI-121-domain-containing protein [Cantharellus anzutake]|uniref:kinase binding protein CGI-121-domain-containing protein n=1 Tax=Cantharellus anzutake TaxID=1750568 RepID=UPI001906D461|nr:kinase binding protein CGI-121-domain-containing protein [Cantharellus anzutake]KAF8334998.1 kinase binding protein CGI-121-domain-containing protein [Cantharellus anzutake]
MAAQSWAYPGLAHVHVCLFTNVKNSSAIRARLVSAASTPGEAGDVERAAVNFAFIDAAPIIDSLHLQTAVLHAILSFQSNQLRTKSVHSEILFALNPSNNITESIRRFGISNSTTSIILVRVENWTSGPSRQDDGLYESMRSIVQGDVLPLTHLSDITDWGLVSKYYKINQSYLPPSSLGNSPTYIKSIADTKRVREIVISTVATKMVM